MVVLLVSKLPIDPEKKVMSMSLLTNIKHQKACFCDSPSRDNHKCHIHMHITTYLLFESGTKTSL